MMEPGWGTLLAETKISFEDKEYVLAVGYVYTFPTLCKNLYIRIWEGDHCICGDFIDPYLRPYVDANKSKYGMSPEFIKFCIDQAERIEKLRVFA
ncbi:MAG TPA: hypothetical protein VII94_03935 [Candidatus Saccharimonadales bacterium]